MILSASTARGRYRMANNCGNCHYLTWAKLIRMCGNVGVDKPLKKLGVCDKWSGIDDKPAHGKKFAEKLKYNV
jgi:hypothetical protein